MTIHMAEIVINQTTINIITDTIETLPETTTTQTTVIIFAESTTICLAGTTTTATKVYLAKITTTTETDTTLMPIETTIIATKTIQKGEVHLTTIMADNMVNGMTRVFKHSQGNGNRESHRGIYQPIRKGDPLTTDRKL